MGIVNEFFQKQFYRLGFCIGENPKKFIFTPLVLLLLVLVPGLLKFDYDDDVVSYNIDKNGVSGRNKIILEKTFHQNTTSKFTPSRQINFGRYASIIVMRKDGKSILDAETWSELMNIDKIIRGVSIEWETKSYNYSQLCATWNSICFANDHLNIGKIIDKIENGSIRLSYPVMFNPITFQTHAINQLFGGIQLVNGSSNTVSSLKVIRLNYFARTDTSEDDKRGIQWEIAVVDQLAALNTHLNLTKMTYTTHASLKIESNKLLFKTLPYFVLSGGAMVLFLVFSSLTGDWVTSKPWVTILGMVSANMGNISALCVLCYMGTPYIGLLNTVPFIALGVGVDDTFVIVGAWWKTSRKDTVPQRMANCYSDAAVSITITSLTDTLCFYVGMLTPVVSVQMFCFYAGTTVMFIYVWHLFFFGGILALSGYGEKDGRHSLWIWKKVAKEADSDNESNTPRKNNIVDSLNAFVAWVLNKKTGRIVVFILYSIYIGLSVWGLLQLRVGTERKDIFLRSSYTYEHYDAIDKYFREFPNRYQVAVITPLDYSNKTNQKRIKSMIDDISHMNYMTPAYMENWLEDFLNFLDNYKDFYNFNVTTEQDFIDTLRTHYIQNTMQYSEDIKFNENFTKIVATRYIVQSHNVKDATADIQLLSDLIQYSNEVKDLDVAIYHPENILDDLNRIIKLMTIILLGIATVIVLVITFLFIPNIHGVILTFFSVVSIELGVVGFMSLWNVHLDNICIITLIMCIGFSVDFPIHIFYAYHSSKFDIVEEKINDAVHSLGIPILQGALSTQIAVMGLIFIDSYITHVFAKVVTLVMAFSVFNGLFVLPILLFYLPRVNSPFSKTKSYSVNKGNKNNIVEIYVVNKG